LIYVARHDQVKLPFALWTREAVQNLLAKCLKPDLTIIATWA
jgi:hypothetical protein